jgi:hypothetical protein
VSAESGNVQPVAYIRYRSDGGFDGPILADHACDIRRREWTPLYPHPDPVRDALVEALTHAVEIAEARRDGNWDDLLQYRALLRAAGVVL